jgi:hypothetical protein
MQTNNSNKSQSVTKLFNDRNSVEGAYKSALNRGYSEKDINVLMSDDTRKKYFADGKETVIGDKSMDGLAIGGAVGGTVAGLTAAIAAIGTAVVVPGLGLVVAGPLAAGLLGAGAGSIAGGLIGTMVGLGIPEERVKEYENGIKQGGILMTVKPRSDQDFKELNTEWNSDKTL